MNYSSCRHPLDPTTLPANFESEYTSFYLMKTNLTSFLSLVNCPRHLSSTMCHIISTLSFNLNSKISTSSATSFQSQQQTMSTPSPLNDISSYTSFQSIHSMQVIYATPTKCLGYSPPPRPPGPPHTQLEIPSCAKAINITPLSAITISNLSKYKSFTSCYLFCSSIII